MDAGIGFIGLGNMGRHMVRRLAESGQRILGYDISAQACDEARRYGVSIAGSVREVADVAPVVLSSLPTPAVAREVIGKELAAGSAARLVIDLSTVGPALAGENAAVLAASGKVLVDAPVSGGTSGAAAGTLAIMVSGPDEAVAKARPLLDVLGQTVIVVGEAAGQAQTVKLINNMLFATHLIAALEGMAMGVACGVDPQRLLDVINASSGRSFITQMRIGPNVLRRDDQVRFATGLLHKDVALAASEATAAGARLDLARASEAFLADAVAQGFAARDYSALIEVFEASNGVSVRADDGEA